MANMGALYATLAQDGPGSTSPSHSPSREAKYGLARSSVETGDLLFFQGSKPGSWLIRAATGSSYNHVGVFFWWGDNLWLAEMREFRGFQLRRASEAIEQADEQGTKLWLGTMPNNPNHEDKSAMREFIFSVKHSRFKSHYGHLSLVKVFISQLIGVAVPVLFMVCSTFAQKVWEQAGHFYDITASPGFMANQCKELVRIKS